MKNIIAHAVAMLAVTGVMVLLSGCGSTKYFFKESDCEKIENGIICEK